VAEPPDRAAVGEAPADDRPSAGNGLAELRTILLGPRETALAAIQERLDNPRLRAADLSEVLPEAVILSRSRDEHLAQALMPTLEGAVTASVKRNPRKLADALFPVMAPAIRKAVSEALRGMLESVNYVLGHSLSPRSLRWRWTAWRTGKPFAEIVLLHTLVYRVEQVLLVHRPSGLLLRQVSGESLGGRHADLVSGMLTAIEDFVHDSFRVREGEVLDTLRVGGLTVRVVQGPHAMVAAVVRGSPPPELVLTLQRALELIHLDLGEALEAFQGDTTPFEAARPHLESCLTAQYAGRRRGVSPAVWLVASALVVALAVWGFSAFRQHRRWVRYLERLHAEPGVVVTTADRRGGRYVIAGLRDPLAADPATLLQDAGLRPGDVAMRWEPFQALRSEFILARAQRILAPPPGVTLSLDAGVLTASGSAPHAWIVEARTLVRAIAGVTALREEGLVDLDLAGLEAQRQGLEGARLHFVEGTTAFAPGQEGAVAAFLAESRRLHAAARALGRRAELRVVGHTDSTGSESTNRALGRQRADTIRALLVARGGAEASAVTAVGVGPTQPLRAEVTDDDRAVNRRVSFQVRVTEGPPAVARP
jgi:OOP family OmpA-OmpF porin